MASVQPEPGFPPLASPQRSGMLAGLNLHSAQWLLGLALLAMYLPSVYRLVTIGHWSNDEHGHGPLVLGISLWLMYRRWNEVAPTLKPKPAPFSGWAFLVIGAVLFISGVELQIVYAEVGSAIFMITGCILLLWGWPMVNKLRFPLIFMFFMIPLPGFLVDPISRTLKLAVSDVVEVIMHAAGYPIARSGVILQVGQYQLLVADACAGMRTLFMLEALGILYLNLVRHSSLLRNITLAILIVPISFTANVIRVIVLALITYHFGDEAGQGFLHGFAGMVLFLSALALIVSADALLRSRAKPPAMPAAATP